MAFDKKPSKYSDRGAVGSPEELDAYGVWVKSEPQDLTASLAEAVNFDAEAVPYEDDFGAGFGADFGTAFGDLEESNFGFEEFEHDIPEVNAADNPFGSFDDDFTPGIGQGNEEASTQLLMKIAGELSSIRTELNTLKREFADIRAENASGMGIDARSDDFFAGEDDEKIALTGDEMEDFLASTDFSEGEGWPPAESESPLEALGFDALREADEAALQELAEQDEAPAADEEIEIDFDNLGIDLNNDVEAEAEAEPQASDDFPPLEDDDFAPLSFEDDASSLEMAELDQEEELIPIEVEDDEELQELRLEGAIPHTPAPDDSDYLERDPFALDDTGFEGTSLDESAALDDMVSEDAASGESAAADTISEDLSFSEDLSLGDSSADLSFDEVSFDLDDFSGGDTASEETVSIEEETSEAFSAESLTSLEEEITVEQEQIPDLSEAVTGEDEGFAQDEVSLEEPALGDLSFDDDISLDMDDFAAGLETEETEETGESLTEESAEMDKADDGLADDSLVMDDFEGGADIDLSGGGLSDDLAIDDFGASVELAAAQDSVQETVDFVDSADDSLAQVIPEGFEVNAEEAAISLDDDLEGFGDELSIGNEEISMDETSSAPAAKTAAIETPAAAGAEDIALPVGLKKDLKNVLSYMDHLLESLPEDKIEEFAKSEYFDTYKKIFKELGLV